MRKDLKKVLLISGGALVAIVVVPVLLGLLVLGLWLGGDAFIYKPQRDAFAEWARTLPIQAEMPAYVVDGTFHMTDGTEFYVETAIYKATGDKDTDLVLPACVRDRKLYVVYLVLNPKKDDGYPPCRIAAIDLATQAVEVLYRMDAPGGLMTSVVTEDYRQRRVWYADGIICLNDGEKVIAFDVTSGIATVHNAATYAYPQQEVWGEIREQDSTVLYLHMNGSEQRLTLGGMGEKNPAIRVVVQLMTEKAGKKDSRFGEAFSPYGVQTVGDETWLLVRSVVHGTEGWMLFLRYDAAEDVWLYAGCEHSWDGRHYDYILVPVEK